MRFVNTVILVILIGVASGIALSEVIPISWQVSLLVFITFIVTLILHQLLALKQYKFSKGFELHTFVASFFCGILLVNLHNPTSERSHYTYQLLENKPYILQAEIIERISKQDYGITYKARLHSADGKAMSGNLLCFFPSKIVKNCSLDSLPLQRDTQITFIGTCQAIAPPQYQFQFNYKRYMEHKYVHWRAKVLSYSDENTVVTVSSVRGFADKIRSKLKTVLEDSFPRDTSAFLKTLLLGDRSDLDQETYQNYINAGAVHILAISGLHVGIITWILLLFLRKLPNMGGYRYVRYAILLLGLGSFAFIAGLSPSVLRATIMFLFIGWAQLLNRRVGRFDALMISMLLLLLCNPYNLYDVGFQLSYGAVFSILTFYPWLKQLWEPKNKFLNAVWSLLLVSFSAQIIVLPLSLYYFHQFPVLFFLSNLIVVPLLYPVLVGGIFALLLGVLGVLPSILVSSLNELVHLMGHFTRIIANQEEFIVRNIHFNTTLFLFSLLIVFSLLLFRHFAHYKTFLVMMITVFLFQGMLFYDKYTLENSEEMLILGRGRQKSVVIRQGAHIEVFQQDTLSPVAVRSYIRSQGLQDVHRQPMTSLLHFHKKNYLLLDVLGIYPQSRQAEIDSVIFLQRPKINFQRMEQQLLLQQGEHHI